MKTSQNSRICPPCVGLICAGFILTLVIACGGDSSTTSKAVDARISPNASPEEIIRNVAMQIGGNVGTNIDGVTSVLDQSSAVSTLLDNTVTNSGDELGVSNRTILTSRNSESKTALTRLMNDDPQTTREDDVEQLMLPTLGVGGNGSASRNGSIITIDPDEHHICLEWMGSDYDPGCRDLLSHLTVQIDVRTENSGTVNYQFALEKVLTVVYAPNEGSYELSLNGFKRVLEHLANTDPELTVPDKMNGSIKLAASVLNDHPGAESGEFSVAVTQPISVVDSSDNLDLHIQNSTLLSVSSDADTGTGEIAMEVLGLVINGLSENTDGSNSTVAVNLPALSMSAVLRSGGDLLTLNNTGLGSHPFTIDVDDINVMRMSLPLFSAVVNNSGGTEMVSFLQRLSLGIVISNMSIFDTKAAADSSASLSVEVPAATTLQALQNDSTKVSSGGPLRVEYTVNDGESNPSGTVVAGAGECFGDDESSDVPIILVACD